MEKGFQQSGHQLKEANVEVKLPEILSYSAGGLANNFVWTGVLSFLTVFWSDTLLIPVGLCGTFMLIFRLWDAINDPMVGSLADKTRTRFGQYRAWIACAFIPMLILFVLAFTKIDGLSQSGQMLFSFVIYFVLVLCNTAVMIPHYSLPSTLTTNMASRGKIVSTRMVGEHIGAITTSAIFFVLVGALGKGNAPDGFFRTALLIAIIAVPFYLWCILGTKERVFLPLPPKEKPSTMFKALRGNTPFWVLFVCFLCWGCASGMLSGLKVYYFKYNLGNEGAFATNMAIWFGGQAIASFIMRYLYKNLKNKRTLPQLGFGIAVIINILLGAITFSAETIPVYHTISLVSGIFMGMGLTGIFSMVPDTTEYTQAHYNLRAAGFLASFVNFANKCGIALMSAVVGWIMALVGYVANAPVQTAGATVLFQYGLHFGSALFMCIAFIALFFYKLDRDSYAKLLDEIDQRQDLSSNEPSS